MTIENYTHYYCDFCEKETVSKKDSDTKSWILISNGGSGFYNQENHCLRFTYNGKEKDVVHDLHFCSKECMVKYFFKLLGHGTDVVDLTETKPIVTREPEPPKKKQNRFSNIDLVVNG
jgi:hypothetical protein